jgi:hypothetical protein
LHACTLAFGEPTFFEERGVVDGDARGRRELEHELLVDFGELVAGCLLGEVEVAEHAVADAHRHAEEAAHAWVMRWEAGTRRVFGDLGESERAGVGDEQSEYAETLGEWADRRTRLVVDADGHELREPGATVVEHAQRAVLRIHERNRRLGDALQHRREVELGTDRDDGVEQLAQIARSRLLGGHGGERTPTVVVHGTMSGWSRVSSSSTITRSCAAACASCWSKKTTSKSSVRPEPPKRRSHASRRRVRTSRCSTCAFPMATASRCVARSARVMRRSTV